MAVEEGKPVRRPCTSTACYPNEFKLFLRSRIRDIETLRAIMGHASFIAMDTEHHHRQKFSSIGLAFASKLESIDHPIHPAAMTCALEERDLATHQPEGASRKTAVAQSICFNVRGFERSQRKREQTWSQPDQDINFEDVASKVMDFVKHFKEAEPERPLILVTYSARAELRAISRLFPQVCCLFSNWVDLQPLVREAYNRHTNYTRLDGLRISLRYAMRTLGFSTGYQPDRLHHAGNDALRTLAIMACLRYENVEFRRLGEYDHVLQMNECLREQSRLKGAGKDRGLKRKRPGPPSKYPHVAKITMAPTPDIGEHQGAGHQFAVAAEEQGGDGQLHLPPADVYTKPRQVWDFFSPYEPNAIGRVCKEKCYYVCVPSESILQQLILDLDKTLACPGAHLLLVEDVSDVRALGAAKREERAKRSQASEEQDWLEDISLLVEG